MKIAEVLVESLGRMVSGSFKLLGPRFGPMVAGIFVDSISTHTHNKSSAGEISFYSPNKLLVWRAKTWLSKEPETIEWIDGFRPGDVLWDIGANVGVYSLYAAQKGVKVLAFEPSSFNFYVLNRNIEINQLDYLIQPYCIAFARSTRIDGFTMQDTQLGGALFPGFGSKDQKGEGGYRQSMLGFSIDDFIRLFAPAFPNHLKLDVDGLEDQILLGASSLLEDDRVRSLLVEMDIQQEAYCERVDVFLKQCGFKLLHRKHAPMFEGTPNAGYYNHVYIRA